jgi:hypothetical protein
MSAMRPLNKPQKYDFVKYDSKTNAKVEAYISPYIRANQALESYNNGDSLYEIREIADLWIRRHDSGLLKDIEPVTEDDLTYDGFKRTILDTRDKLITALVSSNSTHTTEDIVRAYKLGEIMKYSDLISVGQSTNLQIRILEHAPSGMSVCQVTGILRATTPWAQTCSKIGNLLLKVAVMESGANHEEAPKKFEVTAVSADLKRTEPTKNAVAMISRKLMDSERVTPRPGFQARLALMSSLRQNEALEKVMPIAKKETTGKLQ